MECVEGVSYELDEQEENYWEDLSCAEFWSLYDIVYNDKKNSKVRSDKQIPLLNKCGYIERRSDRAVLRCYLDFNNDEDFARGLLILFHPFRNELKEIHEKNVNDMYSENKSSIQARRNIFEKHKVITDIIYSLYKEVEKEIENNDDVEDNAENDDEFMEEESTSAEDIEKFERWMKAQSHTSLRNNKDLKYHTNKIILIVVYI